MSDDEESIVSDTEARIAAWAADRAHSLLRADNGGASDSSDNENLANDDDNNNNNNNHKTAEPVQATSNTMLTKATKSKSQSIKKPRYKWPFKVIDQDVGGDTVYPFLDGSNETDLVLLMQLLAKNPDLVTAHGKKGAAWEKFVNDLRVMKGKDGKILFKDIAKSTITARVSQYEEAVYQWKHKTGVRLPATVVAAEEKAAAEDTTDGRMPICWQIMKAAKNIVRKKGEHAENIAREEAERKQADFAKKGQAIAIKQAAVGKLGNAAAASNDGTKAPVPSIDCNLLEDIEFENGENAITPQAMSRKRNNSSDGSSSSKRTAFSEATAMISKFAQAKAESNDYKMEKLKLKQMRQLAKQKADAEDRELERQRLAAQAEDRELERKRLALQHDQQQLWMQMLSKKLHKDEDK